MRAARRVASLIQKPELRATAGWPDDNNMIVNNVGSLPCRCGKCVHSIVDGRRPRDILVRERYDDTGGLLARRPWHTPVVTARLAVGRFGVLSFKK